jgi:agmatine/peptidylarginine deiminase
LLKGDVHILYGRIDKRALSRLVSPLLCLLFLGVPLSTAIPGPPGDHAADQERNLPIHLTDEEMTRLDEIGIYHTATAPPSVPVRKIAEWEPVTGVLIRFNYGFGLPYDLIREYAEDLTVYIICLSGQQSGCSANLENNGVNMANIEFISLSTNSMWTRDYGPLGVFSGDTWGIVDHIYNRPRPLDDQVNWSLGTLWGAPVYGTDLVHTGGNFLYDGHGMGFSTDLVWDENPELSETEIEDLMEEYLGISDYVVLPDISTSGIHHIDCWMKLLNEETILVKQVDTGHPDYDAIEDNVSILQGLTNCYGRPYDIVRVYCGSIIDGDVAAYTNSMILNNKVFVPLYGISTDAAALATYEAVMPGYEVFGYTGAWLSDDAIHCRTMELNDRQMLVVDTDPLQDLEFNTDGYRVSAFIDDLSGTGLIADSLLIHWRPEGAPEFCGIPMSATAYSDSYAAYIPAQADSVDVEYYVSARDNSGRRSTRPVVAPGAWYSFNTGGRDLSGLSGGDIEPHGFRLAQNTPNPFRERTRIGYELSRPARVRIAVHDVRGREVAVVEDSHHEAGIRWEEWDGRSDSGDPLPSGVYFYTITSGGQAETRRMVLLR